MNDHDKTGLPNLDLPPKSQSTRVDRKSLTIAFVVSTIFLLAAIGVTTWMFVQKSGGNQIITQIDPNSTVNVKTVSWVAPTMPEGYVPYNQSTNGADVQYYANSGDGCSVTTRVLKDYAGTDLLEDAVKASDSLGIQAKVAAGEQAATIKDADGQRQYDFAGTELDQSVSVPTLDYSSQSGVIYYKQFGNNLAIVSFTCRIATLEANSEKLTQLLKTFTVKTER